MTKKTLYLIHHSHTDIGYTDRQEKISRAHTHYLKSAIHFLEMIEQGQAPQWKGYKYTCENYWQVEQFLKKATTQEIALFEKYVEKGLIDISLTYLNLTELVDEAVLDQKFKQATNYVSRYKRQFDSAMTADINGFSWGYADAMTQNGIKNFFTCIHTHHGMFPLFKKQTPFWWQTQKGEKILVWSGDHYQIGNDFLFIPNNDQSKQYDAKGFTDAHWQAQLAETKTKVFNFFEGLVKEDYPYDFCPVMISGIVTDNSPTSPQMMLGIQKFNEQYGTEIQVELVTLNEFFKILRQKNLDIPTYQGDWADWWADGIGSTPAGVKIYRDAQRKYRLVNKLKNETIKYSQEQYAAAQDNLMMYAEHTWGYHSSVYEPWDAFVNQLDMRKTAYAINANRQISDVLDDTLEQYGQQPNQLYRPNYYKVINPHDHALKALGEIYIQHWQTIDDSYFNQLSNDFVEVIDTKTQQVITSQVSNTSRGKRISFYVDLPAKSERIVMLRRKETAEKLDEKYRNQAFMGAERVKDIANYAGYENPVTTYGVTTPYFEIKIDQDKGVVAIIDRKTQQELIHPQAKQMPFTGIYEVTTSETLDPCSIRRQMGRNRKSQATQRFESQLQTISVIEDGPLYASLLFKYQLEGTQMFDVFWKIYKQKAQIDVAVRIEKDIQWSPENLYLAMPFTYGDPNGTQSYIQKTNSILRPAIDQLPGSNTEFYLVDNGLCWQNDTHCLFVAPKDTPLVTYGPLDSRLIELCQPTSQSKNKMIAYNWVMNNFWETNFKVDLAGFYEFDYSLYLFEQQEAIEKSVQTASEYNEGFITIPFTPNLA